MIRSAVLSPCGTYRYSLTREETPPFNDKEGAIVFVLLNPSTADAEKDDQTVRKCWKYTRDWGYARMIFVNTNPYRSTDPKSALVPPESILAENDTHLRYAASQAAFLVCAWSTKVRPELAARALGALWLQKPLYILELSKGGIPKHPLYLKGDLLPTLWRRRGAPTVNEVSK